MGKNKNNSLKKRCDNKNTLSLPEKEIDMVNISLVYNKYIYGIIIYVNIYKITNK